MLVAIAIPIFTTQLEKSREATDATNLRAAYAEVMTEALTNDGTVTARTVAAKQKQAKWQNTTIEDIGGLAVGDGDGEINAKVNGATWSVGYDATNGTATIN